jgi:hypothetical protein
LTEASLLVDRLLNAGARVEEMISQLGREKRLDTNILRAIDKKMGVARKSVSDHLRYRQVFHLEVTLHF